MKITTNPFGRVKKALGAACAFAISAVLAATLALAPFANAAVGTLDFGITNSLTALTTNTTLVGSSVSIDNKDNGSLVFIGVPTVLNNSNIVVTLMRSGDNVNFETTPQFTWTIPMSGTNVAGIIVAITNLPAAWVSGVGYLKVFSIAQQHGTSGCTNVSLSLIKKRLE